MRYFVIAAMFCALSLPGCGGSSSEPIIETEDDAVEMSDEDVAAEEAISDGEESGTEVGSETDI